MISLITEMTKMKPNAIIVLENMQFDDQITAVCQERPCNEFAWTYVCFFCCSLVVTGSVMLPSVQCNEYLILV